MSLVEHHISPRPDRLEGLLADYDPTAFGLLKRAFETRRQNGDALLPTTVRTGSGLVLARTITDGGRDTVFSYHSGLSMRGTSWSFYDVGKTVLGTRIHTDNGTQLDVDGNPVLLLDALDMSGNPLSPPNQVSIEVQEAALDGLRVYTQDNLPKDLQLFNPYSYLPTPSPTNSR